MRTDPISPDHILIRPASPDEIDEIYDMGRPTFADPNRYDWGWERPFLERLVTTEFGFIDVAVAGEELIALHCGAWNYPDLCTTKCRMLWLFVQTAYRRLGIGTRLLHESVANAQRMGKTEVCIGAWEADRVAQRFLTRAGLAPTESLIIYQAQIAELAD